LKLFVAKEKHMKKLIALLICLCLMLGTMAGCGASALESTDTEDTTEAAEATVDETAEEADATEDETVTGIGLGGTGYETYDPDTVVGTVNGEDVTWMEYYYWLNYYTQYVQSMASTYGVTLSSWDANELSSDNTNAQVVLLNAQYAVTQYHVMETEANDLGITLSEEDEETLQSVFDQNADYSTGDGDGECTEEEAAAFEEYLAQQNVDRDFFDYLNRVSLLNNNAFLELYGENGSAYPDEDVMAYAEDNGLMAAKHILLLTVDTSTGEALDDDTIAEKKALAEDLNAQLQAVADDQDAMVALFDELMDEYTEDTGYAYYPDGYIFSDGEMVEAFEDAVKALDENYGLSEIVESEYGYHIILRIPVNPDATAGTDSYGNAYSLRNIAASEQFSGLMDAWMDAADVQWNDGFETLDLLAIFG
jgi:hypothetical protein